MVRGSPLNFTRGRTLSTLWPTYSWRGRNSTHQKPGEKEDPSFRLISGSLTLSYFLTLPKSFHDRLVPRLLVPYQYRQVFLPFSLVRLSSSRTHPFGSHTFLGNFLTVASTPLLTHRPVVRPPGLSTHVIYDRDDDNKEVEETRRHSRKTPTLRESTQDPSDSPLCFRLLPSFDPP